MNRSDHEPLTAEERLLAERLGGDGRGPSPSPAIDAAILAAARAATVPASPAATATGRRQPARARRRWPFAAGIAASLALAVGIAWQLRPTPDTLQSRDWAEMPASAPAAAATASSSADARRDGEATRRMMSAPPAPDEAVADPPVAEDAVPKQIAAKARSAAPADMAAPVSDMQSAPQPTERGTALGTESFAAPAPAPPAVSLAPPPPAPPAPPAPAPTSTPSPPPPAPAPASGAARAPASAEAAAPRQQSAQAPRTASRALFVEAIDELPDDSDPPATADAPEVRAAWLVRVRELLDAGRIAEAKASLMEFHRRHPQAELPPDLRALLD